MRPDVTFILARMLGPLLIIGGILLITQTARILSVTTDFLSNDALLLLSGFIELILGLGVVTLHQRWNSFTAFIVSLLGWVILIEGMLLLFAPEMMREAANTILIYARAFPILGCVLALLGVWLTYAGYIAGTLRVETSGGELGDPRR